MGRSVKEKYSRSSVNEGQVKLLELLYKYRFGSRQLLAESLGIKPENGLYEKLEVLVKREYVGKRFEKRLKLQGVPVAYYITPKGLRALQAVPKHEDITDLAIKRTYRDKSVGMPFIIHTLSTYKYTNQLCRYYPLLRVFTEREVGHYEYFPSRFPDAVLSLGSTSKEEPPKRFFFDLIPDAMPRFALDRRIAAYLDFFNGGGWKPTKSALPTLLFVGESGAGERRIQRVARIRLNQSDEISQVYTSTTAAFDNLDVEKAIWTNAVDTDELVDLSSIP